MTEHPRKSRRWLIAVLTGLLVGSGGFNVVLYQVAVSQYRQDKWVLLDPASERWFRDDNAKLAAPAEGERRVVFFGDSDVELWEPRPDLPGWQPVYRGRSGDTSAQLLLRLERDVLRLEPAAVVITGGSNDLTKLGAFPGQERKIIDDCKENLQVLVRRLRERNIPIVLLTMFPLGRVEIGRWPVWSDATYTALDEVNANLRGLEGVGVTVLDCDAVLAVNGRQKPAYARDWQHLNAAGYGALNPLVRPALDAFFPGKKPPDID